jgi:CheY-like chemotaxis protein
MQILVVDDDPDLSMLMSLFLRKHGHEVETAGDGLAALERIRDRAPDVVVLDWNMPHLDGLGLTAAVRGELGLATLPLLMVTARGPGAREAVHLRRPGRRRGGAGRPRPGRLSGPGRVRDRALSGCCSPGSRAWSCGRGSPR